MSEADLSVDFVQLAEQAAARSRGYWLLSRLFLEPPTPALLADLQRALAAAEGGSSALQADLAFLREAVAATSADYQAAAVEFTRRLIAVPKDGDERLPFEAHFLEGRSPGQATESLVGRVSSWGLRPLLVEGAPPDHLGAELRLMALLCHEEHQHWRRGAAPAARECLARENELLSGHLLNWIPDYCLTLGSRSDHPYLQSIARLTASTLEAEVVVLSAISAEIGAAADEAASPATTHVGG